jgi:APA family basic amino acid/polyamine antiporter
LCPAFDTIARFSYLVLVRNRLTHPEDRPLRRILGTATVTCVGLGVAIGSGILATPGEIAGQICSGRLILLAWLLGGLVTFLESLVTAELSTRIPLAGGEYQFLRSAFGDFAAFFFGWSFTIFIVGAGAGTIAAALGQFTAELLNIQSSNVASLIGFASIIGVLLANLMGLRAGALIQNGLTIVKVIVVVGIGMGAMISAGRYTPIHAAAEGDVSLRSFLLAFVSVFWSYSGSTDSAKLAEETIGARRAIPRGLTFSAVSLTCVYLLYNYGLLCAVSPAAMRDAPSVAALAFSGIGGFQVRGLILIASIMICLGSISSTLLSNVRVTFAMARDGLAPSILARMSQRQAPIPSLIFAALIGGVFVLNRSFSRILGIYFMASAILYGLSYMSLIVFRLRDAKENTPPGDCYRVPFGPLIAILLTVFQVGIAVLIAMEDLKRNGRDSLYMLGILLAIAGMYPVWKWLTRQNL